MKVKSSKNKTSIWKPFIKYFTKFKIPWWLYGLSMLGSLMYTELGLRVVKYTINLQTGKLYNSSILGYALMTLLMAILSIAINMTSNYASAKVTLRARTLLWKKVVELPISEYEKQGPSSLISRITNDSTQASSVLTMLCLLVSSVYSFVRTFIILFQYNTYISSWLLLVGPLAVLNFYIVGLTQYRSYRKIYKSINEMTSFFSEHLGTIKHTKAQVMEEKEREAGFREIEKRYKADCFNSFIVAIQVTSTSLYTRICTVILVLTGRSLIKQGKLESTGLKTGDSYLSNVQKYLAEILTQFQTVKGAQGALVKVLNILDLKEEYKIQPLPMPKDKEDIYIKNLSFSYNIENEILHNINITIPRGKKTVIIGENGSGKTTLFKLLMRLYEPINGTITYGDIDINEINLTQWRKKVGYVLQNAPIISGTIKDNICYGLTRTPSMEEIEEAAKKANVLEFAEKFEEGLDKEVGECGSLLSGGQRQRIAIAREFINDPDILLMDEATASLDWESDKYIWESTRNLMKDKTVVCIAHDMAILDDADNIIVLNKGQVEAQGTLDELINTSETLKKYLSLQQKGVA